MSEASIHTNNLINQANTFFRNGKGLEALTLLRPSVDDDQLDAVLLTSNIYWSLGQHSSARKILASSPAHHLKPVIKNRLWFLGEQFYTPLKGRKTILARRGPGDAEFVKKCWSNNDFMLRFHRFAQRIESDDALKSVLAGEFNANLLTSNALHWTVSDLHGRKLGFTSLVDFSVQNRRAELIVGVIDPAYGIALESTLLTMDFAFRILKLNKLCTVIYDQNDLAIKSTAHLGFISEGVIRQHIRDPLTGHFLDLHNSSMLAGEYFSNGQLEKIRARLARH